MKTRISARAKVAKVIESSLTLRDVRIGLCDGFRVAGISAYKHNCRIRANIYLWISVTIGRRQRRTAN